VTAPYLAATGRISIRHPLTGRLSAFGEHLDFFWTQGIAVNADVINEAMPIGRLLGRVFPNVEWLAIGTYLPPESSHEVVADSVHIDTDLPAIIRASYMMPLAVVDFGRGTDRRPSAIPVSRRDDIYGKADRTVAASP
jgi:hypothetical protein